MDVVPFQQIDCAEPVRRVDDREDLAAILDRETDAVIWSRKVPPPVLSSLATMPVNAVREGRFTLPARQVTERVSALLADRSGLERETRDWLAADVEMLAGMFEKIFGVSHMLLRIEWVHDDACRLFHRDLVTARLICTYRGPGTEYGVADKGKQPSEVHTAPTGSVLLLKGGLWPETPRKRVLHRSPPIEGTGVSRLVIVINEA